MILKKYNLEIEFLRLIEETSEKSKTQEYIIFFKNYKKITQNYKKRCFNMGKVRGGVPDSCHIYIYRAAETADEHLVSFCLIFLIVRFKMP